MSESINWIPSTWYATDWPKMRAFAIPGLDEGMVRINVKSRDPFGCVEPDDYENALHEVGRLLLGLSNARTGRSLVHRFFRTRRNPLDDGPHLPPADLIVEWTEEPCDVADSSLIGRMGPVPLRRTGGHSRTGFAWFRDARLSSGERPAAMVYDLGPTLLDLNGTNPPHDSDGCSLLRDWRGRVEHALFPEFAVT